MIKNDTDLFLGLILFVFGIIAIVEILFNKWRVKK